MEQISRGEFFGVPEDMLRRNKIPYEQWPGEFSIKTIDDLKREVDAGISRLVEVGRKTPEGFIQELHRYRTLTAVTIYANDDQGNRYGLERYRSSTQGERIARHVMGPAKPGYSIYIPLEPHSRPIESYETALAIIGIDPNTTNDVVLMPMPFRPVINDSVDYPGLINRSIINPFELLLTPKEMQSLDIPHGIMVDGHLAYLDWKELNPEDHFPEE